MSASKRVEHPAMSDLRGILSVIESSGRKGKTEADALVRIKEMTLSALELLSKPDPKTERVSLIVLMLRQTINVEEKIVRGKQVIKVHILDQLGYNWAMLQIHNLPLALGKTK